MRKARPSGKAYLPLPWNVPEADEYTIRSFHALRDGVASPQQAKTAFEWLINEACGYYELSFRAGPDGDRLSAFAEGKRFVGGLIVAMTKVVPKP